MKASASSGSSGAVPETTERTLERSAGSMSASSTMRNAAGTRLTVAGRCRRTASDQRLHREAVEEAERSAVADALQDAEEATQMHQRRVHDGDTAPEAHRLVPVRLVVLGPDEYMLEHPVTQIDTLGRAGGAAGEHAHGHARASSPGSPWRPGAIAKGRATVRHTRRRGGEAVRNELGQVVGFAGEHVEVERCDVLAGALAAPPRVDGDDATACAQHAQEEPDRCRPVAQKDPHLGAGSSHQGGRLFDRVGQVPQVDQAPSNSTAGASGSTARTSAMRAARPVVGTVVIARAAPVGPEDAPPPRPCRSGCRGAYKSAPAPWPPGRDGRATPRWPAPCPSVAATGNRAIPAANSWARSQKASRDTTSVTRPIRNAVSAVTRSSLPVRAMRSVWARPTRRMSPIGSMAETRPYVT